MLGYTIRRLLVAIPSLLFASFVLFILFELSPGDPMSQIPISMPAADRMAMKCALDSSFCPDDR